MSNRGIRSISAMAVVVASAVPGLVGAAHAAAPAAPVVPIGGCWWYAPAVGSEIGDASGGTPISTALVDWATTPSYLLATSGDTALNGVRDAQLSLTEGPALPAGFDVAAEREGTAAVFYDVVTPDGTRAPIEAPVLAELTVPQGAAAIGEVVVDSAERDANPDLDGLIDLAATGTYSLEVRQVVFSVVDAADAETRAVCNGQELGDPAGENPATTPLPTDLVTGFDVVAAASGGIVSVTGQNVTTAARAGDSVELFALGFPSAGEVQMELCGTTADAECAVMGTEAVVAEDGTLAVTERLPEGVAVGDRSLRLSTEAGAAPVVEVGLQILGTPEVEIADAGKRRIKVAGAQWDPQRDVRLRAVDEDGKRIGKAVVVTAGAQGAVKGTIVLPADAEVAEVVARQSRGTGLDALEARIAVEGESAPPPATTPDNPGDSTTSPGDTSAGTPVAEAPGLVEVPDPEEMDPTVVDPDAPVIARDGDTVVTQATLEGSTRFADLFGAGPKRTLVLEVSNVGEADAVAPGLQISVGKGDDLDPIYRTDGFGRLGPGESLTVEIPISLPAGAFGTYTVAGQIGQDDLGRFTLQWETYPWGLLALNGLGVLLVAWAVRRRLVTPKPALVASLAGSGAEGAVTADGEAVIDLATLERWWALQDAPAELAGADAMDDAVVDVEAVEAWLERCASRNVASL